MFSFHCFLLNNSKINVMSSYKSLLNCFLFIHFTFMADLQKNMQQNNLWNCRCKGIFWTTPNIWPWWKMPTAKIFSILVITFNIEHKPKQSTPHTMVVICLKKWLTEKFATYLLTVISKNLIIARVTNM